MVDPIITKQKVDYRISASTPAGWLGLPDGSWIIDSVDPPRANDDPGITKPNKFTAGTNLNRARTVWSGSSVLSTSDIVYRDIAFMDYMRVTATNVQFINCSFNGSTAWPTVDTPLVDCRLGTDGLANTTNPWAGLPYFEDCLFKPRRENYRTDGIMGYFYLNRCEFDSCRVAIVVDAIDNARRARARVEKCYVDQLSYWYAVPWNQAGGTQNYCVDIRCAGDIWIIGNTFRATGHPGDDRNFNDPDTISYPGGNVSKRNPLFPDQILQANGPHANGGPIRVVQTRTLPFDGGLVIEKNWLSKGMTGADLANGADTFSANRFARGRFYVRSSQNLQYYIKLGPNGGASISGLTTNVFEDNNQALSTTNGGIQ